MAKGKIELGYEVTVRATVIGIWDDGSVTVQIKSAGQRVTLTSDSDIEPAGHVRRSVRASAYYECLQAGPFWGGGSWKLTSMPCDIIWSAR